MTEIEVKIKFKLVVHPQLTLNEVHNSVKEWIKKSSFSYHIKGVEGVAPVSLLELETSSEHLAYITYIQYDDDGKEDNHIKTKIHVP